ncbi:MAG: mechanosensitive ion channel domain-containing protein [Myxococcota bacterium]
MGVCFQRLLVLLAVFILFTTRTAEAKGPSPCETPRSATASLLENLQTDHWHPDKAVACVDLPDDTAEKNQRMAIRLKQILDAKALYVSTDGLPDDPNYRDEEGRAQVTPLDAFPVMVIVKRGDRWVYSRSTMQAVPGLYKETFSSVLLAIQEQMPPFFFQPVFGLFVWQYVYFIVLVAMSLAVGWLAQALLTQQIVRLAERLELKVNTELIKRIRAPLTWFATGLVFNWGIPDLQLAVQATLVLKFIAVSILSISAVVILTRFVDLGADLLGKRAEATDSKLDDQVIPLLSRAIKVVLWALGIVFILQNVGVEVTALLAGVSVGGVAVALAAQDTMSNLFGSLTIFTDRPFQIGDWVIIDGKTEGVVEEVGFRSTRIRTFGKSVVSVPNAKVANSTVDNMGLRTHRRLKLNIGLTYDTTPAQMRTFLQRIHTDLQARDGVVEDSTQVRFVDFGGSSLDVMVYTFLDVQNWTEELVFKQELMLQIMEIAEEIGVRFAFPSTSVYFESALPAPNPPK